MVHVNHVLMYVSVLQILSFCECRLMIFWSYCILQCVYTSSHGATFATICQYSTIENFTSFKYRKSMYLASTVFAFCCESKGERQMA